MSCCGKNPLGTITNIHELVRPEHVVPVIELSLEPARPGGLINLVINREQAPRCQLGLVVTAVSLRRKYSFMHVAGNRGKLIFGQRKNYGNRLELRDYQHGIRVRSVHDVTGIYKTQTDPAIDRRSNMTISQL